MSSLEDKIDEILAKPLGSIEQKDLSMIPKVERTAMYMEIKQAFIDEEWIPSTASAGFRDRYNIMRGQEWYERFEKEMQIAYDKTNGIFDGSDAVRLIRQAAKKAAGVQ